MLTYLLLVLPNISFRHGDLFRRGLKLNCVALLWLITWISLSCAGEITPPLIDDSEVKAGIDIGQARGDDNSANPNENESPIENKSPDENTPPRNNLTQEILSEPGLALELEAERLECRSEILSAQNIYTQAMLEVATAAIKSKEPERLWARAEFNLEKALALKVSTNQKEMLEATILKVQELPGLEPIFASRLIWAQANFALQSGETERAGKLAGELKLIREWMIIGPFNNKHGNFEYPAEDGLAREWPIDLNKPRQGIKGQLSWRHVRTREPLAFINLGAWMRPNEDCLAYAITTISASEDTNAVLRLGSDDMVSVWCNGRRLNFLEGRRKANFDQDAVVCPLKKGLNILLIQSGNTKDTWGFYARLTALDGAVMPAFQVSADYNKISEAIMAFSLQGLEMKKNSDNLPEPFQGALSTFAKKLEESPQETRTNYYLGWLLMNRHSLPPTDRRELKYLLQASKGDLENPIYYLAFAEASIDRSLHEADRDENARRLALQYAVQLGKEQVEARTRLADYYLYSMQNLVRAEQLAEDALKANPMALAAQLILYDIYSLRGWSALVTKSLAKMRLRYPDSREILGRSGMDALDREANAEAVEYYQRLVELDHTSATAIQGLIEAKQRLGEQPEFEFLRKLIIIKPYDPFLRQSLVEAYVKVRNYQAAYVAIEEALAIAPEDALMLEWKGRVLLQLGNREEALRVWDKALALKPNLLSLKNRIEFLRKRKDSLCSAVPDLREFVSSFKDYPTHRGDSRLYLLREIADRINSDGTCSQAVHYVVKVLDQQASRDLAVVKLAIEGEHDTLQLITARVMRADGTIEAVHNNDDSGLDWGKDFYQELSFAPLNVGDVIEVAYRRDESSQDFFGDYFGETFRFRYYYPVAIARYILESPLAREIHIQQSPEVPEPVLVEDTQRGVKRQEWEMQKLEAIELEPYMPPISELSPLVQASSFGNWDDFAKWYWHLIREQYIADENIRSKVRELTDGIEDLDKKLLAIYRYVSEDIQNVAWEFGIHGYKPYKTSTVFSRGFGDCKDKTALICVMAREIGLEAWPALLWGFDEAAGTVAGYSIGRGKEDLTLPLMNHFNHSISAVELNGETLWLDGTLPAGDTDISKNIPLLDAGATAVVITPEGASLKKIPSQKAEDNQWDETSELNFLASGDATFNQSVSLRGDVAADLGSYLSNRDLFKIVIELLAKRCIGPLEVEKAELEEPEGEGIEALNVNTRMLISKAAKIEAETMRFQLPPSWLRAKPPASPLPDHLSVFAAESVRAHDLLLPRPFLIKSEIRVSPPAGWRLAWLPSAVEINESFGVLQAQFELEGEVMIVRRMLRIDSTRILRRDYHAFRRFCFRADEVDNLEFVLEKIK